MGCVHVLRNTLRHYTHFHVAVFVLTFLSYAMLHATRKSFSNVKTTMSAEWTPHFLNHSAMTVLTPASLWMEHGLFTDLDDAEQFMGTLDASFMFAYALGLFVSGFIADRSDMRLMLSVGMMLTSLMVFLYGCLFEWLHWYRQPAYLLVWILNGLLQSSIWPCVVAIMGNWFGKDSRGLVLGVWSACASVGNILGSVLVAAVLDYGYDFAFLVPACVLMAVAFLNLVGLVTSPEEVGLDMPQDASDDDDKEDGYDDVGKDCGGHNNVHRHSGLINSVQLENIHSTEGHAHNGHVPTDSAMIITFISEHGHDGCTDHRGGDGDGHDHKHGHHHGLAEIIHMNGAKSGQQDKRCEDCHHQNLTLVKICRHEEGSHLREDRPQLNDCPPPTDCTLHKQSPLHKCAEGEDKSMTLSGPFANHNNSHCGDNNDHRSSDSDHRGDDNGNLADNNDQRSDDNDQKSSDKDHRGDDNNKSKDKDSRGDNNDDSGAAEEAEEKPHAVNFLTALLLPGVVPYALCYAFLKLVNYSFFFWLPFYLSNAYDIAETVAGRLSIWYDLGGVVGGTLAGFLSDRLGTRTVVVMPMLVLAVPLLFVYGMTGVAGSLLNNGLLLFVLGSLIGGVANLISAAISADLGRQKALQGNPKALSTVTGILDGTGSMGAALGQVAVPHLQVVWGWRMVFYMFMVCTALTALCIVRIFWAEAKHLVHRFRRRP